MQLKLDTSLLSDDQRERTLKAIQYLQRKQFFFSSEHQNSQVRRAFENPSIRDFVKTYFRIGGFELHFNETEGWYGILPRGDEVSPGKMTKVDTIILLCLSLHWETCILNADTDARGNGISDYNTFFSEVTDYLTSAGGQGLKDAQFRAALKTFQDRNIVQLSEFDEDTDNAELIIRPFVRLLTGEDALARINAFLSSDPAAQIDEAADNDDTEIDPEDEAQAA